MMGKLVNVIQDLLAKQHDTFLLDPASTRNAALFAQVILQTEPNTKLFQESWFSPCN